MPTKVSVNSEQITVNYGSTFLVTDFNGMIDDNLAHMSALLHIQAVLADYLPDVELTHLRVGNATVGLHFWREGEQTRWKMLNLDGELQILEG